MIVRWVVGVLVAFAVVLGMGASTVRGADVLVTADASLSALATADDTVLHWTGNFTVTVDAGYTGKTVAGIDAGSFTATIDFQNANRKVILGSSTGNVVIEANGGEVRVAGAGTGARTAGFLVSPSLTSETVEVRTAVDDAVNANYWIIGKHRLLLAGTSPQVGAVDVGQDGEVATIDVDQSATVDLITPTGDFTLDLASGKSLTITQSLPVGANTMTVSGTGTTPTITCGGAITLNDAGSVLRASGAISVADLALTASAAMTLLDGAILTLPDAVSIGAQTLTLRGTTGSDPERITATAGFKLDNVNSLLRIEGDTADAMIVSKVDTGAELNVGKGIDADVDAEITALSVLHNVTLDVAAGKTLSGTATMTVARTITLNNTGTVAAITANTAAGTIQFTAAGTVTALTNDIAGTTIDVDESATISTLTLNQNATLDVAANKALTATATVAAGKVLTVSGSGTVSRVVLNGLSAEVNVTGGGTLTTLDVTADGGILDVDAVNCTVTQCNMTAGSGDLTVENGSRTITSTGGFDVNNNTLTISQASGTLDLVTLDTFGGVLDVNESTTITAANVSASVDVQVASGRTLTTTATVNSGGILKHSENGTISAVVLNAAAAELNTTAAGQVTTLNVASDGGVINADSNSTVATVTQNAGQGDLTIDVADGVTLVATIDVNDNRLTLNNTGSPGTISMDTDGGILDVDADCSPNFAAFTANVTVEVADGKTLGGTMNIGDHVLTLSGSGTITRIDGTTGTIVANGSVTIGDLRATFGSGGTFTFDGSAAKATLSTISNSTIGANERFLKKGTGSLTLTGGISTLFSKAAGVRVAVEQGELVVGTSGANNDIAFNDDADEITVSSGATLTTYGSFSVAAAGGNVNLDAAEGSVINLASTGDKSIIAAADNDYQLLGTVSISGAGGTYTLSGPYVFQFGDVTINGTAGLVNNVPSSTMQFVPGSVVTLNGRGADGGTLTVNGQATDTRINMTTTTAGEPFIIDRNASGNLTIQNVALSNSSYRSDDAGAAIAELDLTGTADVGNNTNWFSAAYVADEADAENTIEDDDGADETVDDTSDAEDAGDAPADVVVHVGRLVNVGRTGSASAGAVSSITGATGLVEVTGATSGSLFVTVADGNLRSSFEGVAGGRAVPATMRVSSSVTGDFVAVVQLCVTESLLSDAGTNESELVLYTYQEPDGPWVLAGEPGRYRGRRKPTGAVGDYGYDSEFQCAWAVRDELSDFAAGSGPTESDALADDGTSDDGSVGDGVNPGDVQPTPAPMCGLFGLLGAGLTLLGLSGLKVGSRMLTADG